MTAFELEPFRRYFEARDAAYGSRLARDPERFLRGLEAAAGDDAALARYCARCPVAGASLADYAPRLLELSPSCSVIARIHFRGMDVRFPFVDVSAQTAALPVCLERLFDVFASFAPKAVRVWQSPDEAPIPGARTDMVVYAGHVASLLERTAPSGAHRVRLEADPALDSFDDYVETQRALLRADPTLADGYQPEDRASLLECAEAGAFFRVFVDSMFIAARPDAFRTWRGWCVVEEILAPRFRGQGLAPAMQHALLGRLELTRAPSVFGTIHARNAASSKTALRVGRRPVELSAFVLPDGLRDEP